MQQKLYYGCSTQLDIRRFIEGFLVISLNIARESDQLFQITEVSSESISHNLNPN